jgi:Zn-dependent peptidase ImmA (M78 family)/transcriptional regulator with XRE-family HTH domain
MTDVLSFRSRARLIPERLREARDAKEMTMEELGAAVGVTRQAISFYESGDREPDPETLIRIVAILGQTLSFFTTDRPQNLGKRGTMFFRSFKSKTKRTNRRCEVLSEWFTQVTGYFNERVNFPVVQLPSISPPKDKSYYSVEEIEEAAVSCRRFWGLGPGPIANMLLLLESKGTIVARSEFGTDTVSAFSFWEGSRPFIFLGADRESACRSRFDAAHELGHLVLHRGIAVEELESKLDQIEKEADRFAGAFLLPEQSYPLEVFSTRLSAFEQLKARWKVSIAAQIYRCSDLCILSDDQTLNLRKQLSANRWRKREPLDDKIPPELPKVLNLALQALTKGRPEAAADIVTGIRLSPGTIEGLLATKFPTNDGSPDLTKSVQLKRVM